MMAYQVVRTVCVRYQPKWMARFLFSLTPKVYESTATLDKARGNIGLIRKAILDAQLLERNARLLMTEDADSITISSSKDRPFLKFHIKQNRY